MNKQERMIVTAYTGVLMGGISEYRQWLSDNNLPDPMTAISSEHLKLIDEELKAIIKPKFLELCKG